MNHEQLTGLLKRSGIHARKILGQNFLLNDIALQDMVEAVPIKNGEAVLEIGPGIGNLTALLLSKASLVLSIEKDQQFFPLLRGLKRQHKNFRFVIADILRYNFAEALSDYKTYHVVANIPYYITGRIIQMLIASPKKPATISLLLQKEVAQNIVAKPGNMNLLALSVQLQADAKILFKVLAHDFYPRPKVDSAVVQITPHQRPKFSLADEKELFHLLRAAFAGKRKQLHNTLVNNLGLKKSSALSALAATRIDPKARPQELSIEQWIELKKQITNNK